MAELTKHERQAINFMRMVWRERQVARDRAAQAAEDARVDVMNVGLPQAMRAAPARIATFDQRMGVMDGFDAGVATLLNFTSANIRDVAPDGVTVTAHSFVTRESLGVTDADALGAKMAELRASLPAEKLPLWDEVFGPPE